MTLAEPVYIVAASRTPIGSFNGDLKSFSAVDLGVIATRKALETLPALEIDEVYFGNVLSAGLGQNPARQVCIKSGLSASIPCTTVNKVCASGMKAAMLGAQSIASGQNHTVLVGGMESMSNVPYYSNTNRFGSKFGHQNLQDGIIQDGLFDVYNQYLMGNAAELCATEHGFDRQAQDDYAIESYMRSQRATKSGAFKNEIAPVVIKGTRGGPDVTITCDQEVSNLNEQKLRAIKPAFASNGVGTVTAPNSSPLSDGAAALVLMSGSRVSQLGIKPLAKFIGWADAAKEPERFTEAPALAIPKAIAHAGLSPEKINLYEINEAFSVVALANLKLLNLDSSKVNVNGGAVSMGHPLGCSGARVMVTLVHALNDRVEDGYGCAGICNGGGGASSVVISVAKSNSHL